MTELARYRDETRGMSASELLAWTLGEFGPQGVTFASSLGAEDQVVTHLIAEHAPAIPVFTLDTGRLFPETYELIEATRQRYGLTVRIYFPPADAVEEMVAEHGPNLFYESVEYRKLCCHVRKVVPLQRALAGRSAWVCGLRRAQSRTREEVLPVDWDETNGLYRIAPLASWSDSDVWEAIRAHKVPYNRLHDHGFPSIGCAPCTRAVAPGDDPRSGRWWWEQEDHRECGLHQGSRQTTPVGNGEPPRPEEPFGIRKITG
jgi:phosphoadenosine phosphosulfate reductase